MSKAAKKAAYGDFQTPRSLAQAVCALLAKDGLQPAALLEPTCGVGNFLFAALDAFPSIRKAIGADINPAYIARATATLQQHKDAGKGKLLAANFFVTDWERVIKELPEPILIVGNLPWVTNAHLSVLGSQNLPIKSNFQNRNGLDAITGKANFDISEWMLIRLLEALNGRQGTLAILCKASVARKALHHGWKTGTALERSALYRIDADLHFGAAVDAVLLATHFNPGARDVEAKVYQRLQNATAHTVIGYEDGLLLADLKAYQRFKHLCGGEAVKWRSGIKHDCSKVMELCREGKKFRNGLGKLMELEETYLYPMLKSSEVASGGKTGDRYMIVTQKAIGESTASLRENAPKTWAYLNDHAQLLNKRASLIYRDRPPFSIFGIGDYTFAPWKVAISGFYKKLTFVVVGPVHKKPIVFDDTCYFLPCQTKEQADYLASLLNSPVARSFYNAFVFWDSKRPITAELLRRLNLRRLSKQVGSEEKFDAYFGLPVLGLGQT